MTQTMTINTHDKEFRLDNPDFTLVAQNFNHTLYLDPLHGAVLLNRQNGKEIILDFDEFLSIKVLFEDFINQE